MAGEKWMTGAQLVPRRRADRADETGATTMDEDGNRIVSDATNASRNVSWEWSANGAVAHAQLATLIVIFSIAVSGNACVLVAMAVRRVKITRMYYFLIHLCISDLITAFFNVLPQLAWKMTVRFLGDNPTCKTIKYLQILGPYLSSYVLVMTAVDRYQAICHPMTNCSWTPRRSASMIAVAWFVALVCCIPQAFIFSYQEVADDGVYDCWATFVEPWGEKAYVTWYAVSVFFLPLVILVFTYVSICRALWKNLRLKRKALRLGDLSRSRRSSRKADQVVVCGIEEDSTSSSSRGAASQVLVAPRSHSILGMSRAKMKTVKLTVVVIACYVACSSPFLCVQLWACWYPPARQTAVWKGPTVSILMLLASLNSCANPWIYMAFNPNLSLRQVCRRRQCELEDGRKSCVQADDTDQPAATSDLV